MLTTNALASIGASLGDPARANILVALMDGRALTAKELAACAGVTPQTTSTHLSRLVGSGLIAVERQGRHRYHRLATVDVARMIEGMMAVAALAPDERRPTLRTGPRDLAMRVARTCYDHLAGRVSVAIADRMIAHGYVTFETDGGELTASGAAFLAAMGVDLSATVSTSRAGRVFCRPCLDWSERRPHIAGHVGASLCRRLLENHWIETVDGSRVISVTQLGRRRLEALFDLGAEVWTGHG